MSVAHSLTTAFRSWVSPFDSDVRENGEPSTVGNTRIWSSKKPSSLDMWVIGVLIASLLGVIVLPLLPSILLMWLYSQFCASNEPTAWEDLPL